MDALTCFPAEFRGGTTLKVTRTYSDFPADDGWITELKLLGPATLTVAGTADGTAHLFVLAATATDTEAPAGAYTYVVQAAKAGEVYEAERGVISVLQSLTGVTGNAGLSANERLLAAVELMLTGKLSAGDMQSYQIAGRALARYTFKELLDLRTALQTAVAQEKGLPGAFGGEVLVDFNGTGINQ